jgi:hypothetical protein
MLPALVAAATAGHPRVGTLVLDPQPDGSLGAEVQRGSGTTLDAVSTLWTTRTGIDASRQEIAALAGDLASLSGADVTGELQRLQLEFVVVPPLAPAAGAQAAAVRQRASEALDANPALEPVGTTALGSLWRFGALRVDDAPAAARTPLSTAVLAAQGVVVVLALLLAIPTGRRRRVVQEATGQGDDPADTFDEDENG